MPLLHFVWNSAELIFEVNFATLKIQLYKHIRVPIQYTKVNIALKKVEALHYNIVNQREAYKLVRAAGSNSFRFLSALETAKSREASLDMPFQICSDERQGSPSAMLAAARRVPYLEQREARNPALYYTEMS